MSETADAEMSETAVASMSIKGGRTGEKFIVASKKTLNTVHKKTDSRSQKIK